MDPWWQRWMLLMGLTTWTSTHWDRSGYSCCWMQGLPTTETKTEPQIWVGSSGWPASDLLDSFSQGKDKCFVLTGVKTCSGYRFAFLVRNTSAKATIPELTERLTHPHGIPYSIASDQGTPPEVKNYSKPTIMESSGCNMFPYYPETAGLMGRWDGLLKTVTGPIRWQQHGGLRQDLSKGSICFRINVWYMVQLLPWSRNKEVRKEIVLLTLTPSDPQGKFCFLQP